MTALFITGFVVMAAAAYAAPPMRSRLSGACKDHNVILVILDALRSDHLGCYGYSRQTSPHIDALAEKGVIFRNAFSQAPFTLPSVVSIFTSVQPVSHKTAAVLKDAVPDRLRTWAQILGTYGYKTAWFGPREDPHTGSAPGLLKGFSEIVDMGDPDHCVVVDWCRRQGNTPFFLALHSYAAHENTFPYQDAPNIFSDGVSPDFKDRIRNLKRARWEKLQTLLHTDPSILYRDFGREWVEENRLLLERPYSPEVHGKICARRNRIGEWIAYQKHMGSPAEDLTASGSGQSGDILSMLDSAIYEFDRNFIGNVIEQLAAQGILRKTAIIIMADHGNEFMEHGHIGHGTKLYDESIHIPFILYAPGLPHGAAKDEIVQSIDVLPTVLDLLGIPIPAQAQGKSLVGLIDGSRRHADAAALAFLPNGTVSIRTDRWKLVRISPKGEFSGIWTMEWPLGCIEERLFDLRRDAKEQRNIIQLRPKVAAALRQRLQAQLDSLPSYQEGDGGFLPGVDERTQEKIRETGYW